MFRLFATVALLAAVLHAATAQQKELHVVAASPQGGITGLHQGETIFATFDQPMTSLQAVPKDEGSGPMVIQPAIKGKYRWMGTNTITFIPEGPLPFATAFTVKVPAGTASKAGNKLAAEYSWTFETPRPAVVWTSPRGGENHADTATAIFLRFNQPMDPGVVSRSLSLQIVKHGATKYPHYTARAATLRDSVANPEQVIILQSEEVFGMGTSVTVTIKAGILGIQGPLPMTAPYELQFSTHGELAFFGLEESTIRPQTGVLFIFSNGVSTAELLKHISFSPSLKASGDYYENTYPSERLYLPLPALPDSTYSITIKAGLRDRYGNLLKNDAHTSFHVESYLPFVRTRTGIGVLEGYESHKFPISTMNVDSFRIQMGAVNPDRIVPLMRKLSWDYYERMAIEEGILLTPSSLSEEAKAFTRAKTLPTRGKHNVVAVRPLDFDEMIGKNGRGVVFVQVDDMNKMRPAYLKTLVQVTDFGITAKFSPLTDLIWVTNLRDAAPVAGASVEIRNDSNKVVWTGTTDDKGLAKAPGWGSLGFSSSNTSGGEEEEGEEDYYWSSRQPRQWVIVRKGNDVAFTSSEWNDGIEPYRFNIATDWNPQPVTYEGTLFTDRGLYKVNEHVEIKALVRKRTEGTWKIPLSFKTRLVIKNSRGEEIYNKEHRPSIFGSFATELHLTPSSPLGDYFMRLEYERVVRGKKRWTQLESGSFRVEAFRAAEFDVTAKYGRDHYMIGDSVSGVLNAKYLYGAPMKSAKIKWRLLASRSDFTPPGHDGYFFNRLDWLTRYQNSYSARELQNVDTVLDEFGALAVKSVLPVGEFQGSLSLMLEGEATSATRQTLAGRATITVHQGEYYPGIRPSSTFVKTDSAMALSLIAATPEGTLVSGRSLSVAIYQRVWHSVRKAETGGRYAWYSVEADSLIDSSVVKTATEPVDRKFVPGSPGFYYVTVSSKDDRGNALLAQTYFYASGSGYVPWERRNDDRIDLIANKTNFTPGETASIIVKNPYERATALVSIEREGIIRHFTTTLVGSAPQIDIPVESEYLPNIFVSVVLLQGRTARPTKNEEADAGRPSFKIGYIGLSVSPKEKLLNVSVEPSRKDYRPGDTVEVTVHVKDKAGNPRRAEVTLSVADLGILNLIGYRLPNPFDTFYHERGLGVTTAETRMHIIEQRSYDEKGQEVGGGGAALKAGDDIPDADGIRKEFRPSAYWNAALLTDSAGAVSVRFKLPDNLTAFQTMAVAHTKESDFGYGDNSFTVSKPLLLQPSLPRFARVGDVFKSGVVIMNYTDTAQTVDLFTTVKGLRWSGEDTTQHQLAPGQAKEVLFTFTAEKIGQAKFVFRARTASNHDGLQWTIPISEPRLRETVALYESLADKTVQEHVIPPADVYPDMGGVEATAASTAMVGLSGGISYLFHYPYGCLEQRSSAVLPMILAKDLVDAFHFDVLEGKDYRAVVSKTLDEIPLFQRSNGGFSYWKNDGETWGYLSAFAMYTLTQAQRNGYAVDKHTVETGMEYLKRFLHGEEHDWFSDSPYYMRYTRALILYTLALAGKPDFGYMENLYNERADLPLFPKTYLLRALHAAGGKQSMQDELVRDLMNKIKIAPTSAHFEERPDWIFWWCFDSNTRTTAMIMQALVETQPTNPIIPKVVRWLIDEQKVGRWRTTQENLYVVDALSTYMRAYEKDEPDFRATVALEGKTLLNELFKGRSFTVVHGSIPMAELTPGKDYPIDVHKDGTGRLYYGIRMNYYPKGETPAKEEGFSVVKSIEALDGSPVTTAKAGTVLKVTLTVSSTQYRHFVVVDDPVPAGFEVVNTSFRTTSASLDNVEGEGGVDRDDYWYEQAFHHVEKYDDRVLLFADFFTPGAHSYTYLVQVTRTGSYQMPATHAEGMYEPEVFGQSASRVMEIH